MHINNNHLLQLVMTACVLPGLHSDSIGKRRTGKPGSAGASAAHLAGFSRSAPSHAWMCSVRLMHSCDAANSACTRAACAV